MADTEEAPAAGCIRLHHGTDKASAEDLLQNGISQTRAVGCGGTGEFWTTTEVADSETFAQVNPASASPARFSFDVAVTTIQSLLNSKPPQAHKHGTDWYEFLPTSFAELNRSMVNRKVVFPIP